MTTIRQTTPITALIDTDGTHYSTRRQFELGAIEWHGPRTYIVMDSPGAGVYVVRSRRGLVGASRRLAVARSMAAMAAKVER